MSGASRLFLFWCPSLGFAADCGFCLCLCCAGLPHGGRVAIPHLEPENLQDTLFSSAFDVGRSKTPNKFEDAAVHLFVQCQSSHVHDGKSSFFDALRIFFLVAKYRQNLKILGLSHIFQMATPGSRICHCSSL